MLKELEESSVWLWFNYKMAEKTRSPANPDLDDSLIISEHDMNIKNLCFFFKRVLSIFIGKLQVFINLVGGTEVTAPFHQL